MEFLSHEELMDEIEPLHESELYFELKSRLFIILKLYVKSNIFLRKNYDSMVIC